MVDFFKTRARSFKFAFTGLKYLFSTQPNARIHIVVAACVCIVAILLRLPVSDWVALVIAISLVLITEAVNTAIESAVNLTTSEIHPFAKNAKDVAAGAVLLAAITSVVIGLLVLGPPIISYLFTL